MKIKVLIVEPNEAPKVAVIDDALEAMQEIVGGLIQPVYPLNFTDDAILICNDEGKLLGLEPNAFLHDKNNVPYDVVCGTFFICNAPADSENFESLTDAQIIKYCQMYAV